MLEERKEELKKGSLNLPIKSIPRVLPKPRTATPASKQDSSNQQHLTTVNHQHKDFNEFKTTKVKTPSLLEYH